METGLTNWLVCNVNFALTHWEGYRTFMTSLLRSGAGAKWCSYSIYEQVDILISLEYPIMHSKRSELA